MKGHYTPNPQWTNEVWGLTPLNSEDDRFLTCSDDATLRLWSSKKRCMICVKRFDVQKPKKKSKSKKKYAFCMEDPNTNNTFNKKKLKKILSKKGKGDPY